MLKLHVLASGSKGNSSIIENAETGRGILVDAGISKKAFLERCSEATFDPTHINAVFITHEHGDHVKGLGVVMRGLAKLGAEPPIYANERSIAASKPLLDARKAHAMLPLDAAQPIEVAGITVIPFATSHDAAASFGFRFECEGDALGYLTDSGMLPDEAAAALADVRILALEANHCPRMLAQSPYPQSVITRIGSEVGHLSNIQSADALKRLASERLQTVIAMHVSETNNTYGEARRSLEGALAEIEHPARVACGFQNRLTSV